MSHRTTSRKQYSPRSHGDREKDKINGKTRAHGGGGGHGAVKSPGQGESSLRAMISAASNTNRRLAANGHRSSDSGFRPLKGAQQASSPSYFARLTSRP